MTARPIRPRSRCSTTPACATSASSKAWNSGRRRSLPRCRPGFVFLRAHARQPLDKRGDGPDLVVARPAHAEARHRGHLDAVLDHPEQLAARAFFGDLLEVRWIGLQTF